MLSESPAPSDRVIEQSIIIFSPQMSFHKSQYSGTLYTPNNIVNKNSTQRNFVRFLSGVGHDVKLFILGIS